MISVSNEFKTAMKQPVKELDAYILLDEDTKITSADDLIQIKISCDTGMCKTAMRKLEGKYLGQHNLLGKWVQVGFGVKIADGTYEYLEFGSFLVTETTTVKDTGVTTITGYDQMIKTMVSYNKLAVDYPIGLYDYTKKLCDACGLTLGNDCFGINIYDKNKTSAGRISAENDGSVYNDSEYRLSNYINVTGNTKYISNYTFTDLYNRIAFYDENKKFLSKNDGGNVNYFVTPNNAKYVRFGKKTSEINDFMLIKGDKVPKTYQKYSEMNYFTVNQELWENINGITYRDILVQIAQATGTTCIIGCDNNIYFKEITTTEETLTYDNMKKLKLEPIYGEINSVVLSRTPAEDNIYMRDEDSIISNGLTEFKIENNEIIDKDRDNAMTPIYEALHGISYYPFETTTEGLGWYEIADKIDVINDTEDTFNCVIFNFSITIDGGIKEVLKATAETKTQTQYQYATTIAKRVKNTEIIVNKQEQNITQLVTDMYNEDGIVQENFTKVYQDITNIINSVQNSGGSNLIKNSVMFAYDNDNMPNGWTVEGAGSLIINSSAEALTNGSLSGHIFTLLNKTVRQRVNVKVDSEDNEKTYYTFSTKIKKDTTGTCYVKLFNSNEEYKIELNEGESSFYGDYEIKALLPKDSYYDIEFYGSADSNATFTDSMLSIGEYKTQWSQASGEIMNTQVNINVDGVLVKSSVYLGDYTVMSPLEFAGYSNINGTVTKVFSLNKDTTLVKKLEAEDEIKMTPIKIVPVKTGDLQGWAFVPSGGGVS